MGVPLNGVLRSLLATLVVALLLPWNAALAAPGRDDAPGRERQQQREQRQEAEDGPEPARDDEDPAEEPAQDDADEDESTSSDGGSSSGSGPHGEDDPSEGSGGRPSSDGEPSEAAAPGDVVISLSADPERIEVGETSTIAIVVKTATTPVESAELLVDLPGELVLRSSSHPVSSAEGMIRFELSQLSAGSETIVSLVVEGVSNGPAAGQAVRVALTADGTVVRDEISISVGDAPDAGLSLSQSGPLLVQVGDTGSFSMTLVNATDEPVEDAIVVAEIAPELDVVGVTPIAEADAIQLGRSRTGEDIVWTFDSLDPREEVSLTWTAQAVVAGDLEATMTAEASAEDQPPARTRQTTYLGYVRGVRTDAGAGLSATTRQRMVTKLVPVTRPVGGSVGGLLPVTGAIVGSLTAAGLTLVVLGAAMVLLSRRRGRGRVLAVGLLALVLTTTACVSDAPGDRTSSQSSPDASTETPDDATEPADEPEDEVLGVRIEREERGGDEDPAATTGSDTSDTSSPPAPETEVVLVERTIPTEILVAPADPEPLASREGDNLVGIELTAPGDATITSSRTISAAAHEEILVSMATSGSSLTATVTLRNLGRDPIAVEGELVLRLAGSGGASELTSDPIDLVLGRGGETSADFSFSLPPGSYSATGAFRAY